MVKDKIIKMDNGKEYYVLDDIEYNNKKYILSLECDLEKDTVNVDDYLVMELEMANGELAVKRVLDDDVAKIVSAMLLNNHQH